MNRAILGIVGILVVGALTTPSGAALLFLANTETGEGELDLVAGGSGDMNIMLTIRDIDTGFAFANVFLNDDDDSADGVVDVTGVTPGQTEPEDFVFYLKADLPADISWDISNEYGLVMGRTDGEDWGPGTYVLVTLTLTQTEQTGQPTVPVTFEKGGRAPQIFTADVLYPWGHGFDNIIPNFADPGVGAENNPFIINLSIPEPATMILIALGGLAIWRRPG